MARFHEARFVVHPQADGPVREREGGSYKSTGAVGSRPGKVVAATISGLSVASNEQRGIRNDAPKAYHPDV